MDRMREAMDVGDTFFHQDATKLEAKNLFVRNAGEEILFCFDAVFALLLGEDLVLHPPLPHPFHVSTVGLCEPSTPFIVSLSQVDGASAQGRVEGLCARVPERQLHHSCWAAARVRVVNSTFLPPATRRRSFP